MNLQHRRDPRHDRAWPAMAALSVAGAILGVIGLFACRSDRPYPIAAPGAIQPADRLSQLGIFQGDPARQIPGADFIPYEVAASHYSDGASKVRFMYVPPGQQLHAPRPTSTDDRWNVPVGAYFVKTFYVPRDVRDPSAGRTLIETRFLVKQRDGYRVSTYLWTADQRDAIASAGNVDVPIDWIDEGGVRQRRTFHVPGTSQCQSCHQNRALGIRSRQLDHESATLIARGILDRAPPRGPALADPFGTASLDARARSYLDANCSHCHGAGGNAARTGVLWDLEHTDLDHLPRCRSTSSIDGRDHVIVPGDPNRSEFLARMLSGDPDVRMPRGPNHTVDRAGVAVLTEWVSAMTPRSCRS